MTKLSDTQLVLLANAAKRDDRALVRSPKMKPEAAEQAHQIGAEDGHDAAVKEWAR